MNINGITSKRYRYQFEAVIMACAEKIYQPRGCEVRVQFHLSFAGS